LKSLPIPPAIMSLEPRITEQKLNLGLIKVIELGPSYWLTITFCHSRLFNFKIQISSRIIFDYSKASFLPPDIIRKFPSE